MNKIQKLLLLLVFLHIIVISYDTPIIIPMTTPTLTISSTRLYIDVISDKDVILKIKTVININTPTILYFLFI